MSGFNIYFIGLINFFDDSPGKLILIPDGRTPDGNISPHWSDIFVETVNVDKDKTKWWTTMQDKDVNELGVTQYGFTEPCRLTVSGVGDNPGCWPFQSSASALNDSKHAKFLSKLREIDPEIRIVPDKACTIAQIPVRRGELQAFMFGKDAVVTRLKVDGFDGPITITATTDKLGMTKTLVLQPGSDIVITNISNPFIDHSKEDSHFWIYGQLDVHRKRIDEKPHHPDLEQLPFSNPYLKFIHPGEDEFPLPNCSNTGCCAGEHDC